MSESSTSSVQVNNITTVPYPTGDALTAAQAGVRELAGYEQLPVETQDALLRDWVIVWGLGLDPAIDGTWADGVAEFGTVEEYLAESDPSMWDHSTMPDGHPVGADGTAVVAAPVVTEPVPTHTLAQANATLAAFGKQLKQQADGNYRVAALAAQYVAEFLGAAPGKSTRTTAVDRLAAEWLLWDEESMSVSQHTAMTRLRSKVNLLLKVHAVGTLLGDGKGDGTAAGKGKSKGKDQPIAWSTLREFPFRHATLSCRPY